MRFAMVLVIAVGCNQVYGIEETSPSDPNNPFDPADYDLDTYGNSKDNCPSIANETQDDEDGDGVGDVCDLHPGDPTDRIVERTFFADPAVDQDRWYANNVTFESRAAVSDPTMLSAAIRSKRSYEDRFVAAEFGFEVVAWNTSPSVGGVRIELDDVGGPSGNLARGSGYMSMRASPSPTGEGNWVNYVSPELGVGIPLRLVLSYDRETSRNTFQLGATIAYVDVPQTIPPGTVSLQLKDNPVRIQYVVIYGRL